MKKSKSVVDSKFWELTINQPKQQGWFEGVMLRPNLTTFRAFAYDRQGIIDAAVSDKKKYYYKPTKEVVQL